MNPYGSTSSVSEPLFETRAGICSAIERSLKLVIAHSLIAFCDAQLTLHMYGIFAVILCLKDI
jgi:hypothetical protein